MAAPKGALSGDVMVLAEWNELNFKPQHRFYRKRKESMPVSAVDTETEDGYARVIATPTAAAVVDTYDDVMQFLVSRALNKTVVFAYNLQFDFEAMFKHNTAALLDLTYEGTYEDARYSMHYIPKKMLRIKDKRTKYAVVTYDLWQYFQTSLDKAAHKYLGDEIRDIKEDRSILFQKYSLAEIKAYCQEDADRTARLGAWLQAALNSIGFYPRTFVSQGNLAAQYCLSHGSVPLTYVSLPYEVARSYYYAYRGGWFELFRRGRIKVYSYDIVSAYPAILRRLPDIRDGVFVPYDEKLEYGVVKVKINRSLTDINPIGFKAKNTVYYPSVDRPITTWLTAREYKAFTDFYDMEYVKGVSFKPFSHYRRPFSKVIDELFSIKQKAAKGSAQYITAKLIMNAIYGKTIEKFEDSADSLKYTGNLFNPMYAAEVTAYPRVLIANAVKDHYDDLVQISTDSIHIKKPLKLDFGSALGQWGIDAENVDGIFIYSGVYELANGKRGSRGYGNNKSLFTVLDTDGDIIKFKRARVRHVKECYRQGRMKEVATFEELQKELSVVPDLKHLWNKTPDNLRALLTNEYDSLPMPLSLIDARQFVNEPEDEFVHNFGEVSLWKKTLKGILR